MPDQNGKSPSIRFKSQHDDWKPKTLGSLTRVFGSGKFIPPAKILPKGDYPVYGGNGLRGYATKFNHEGLFALIGRQGALCGNMNLSMGKAFITEHCVAVQANESNSTLFLFYLLGKMNLGQYSAQSAQPGLAVTKLEALTAFVCGADEQAQIGSYFKSLDRMIGLHQRKHDKLVTLKQAMLQKMFPQDGATTPEIRFKGFEGEWDARTLDALTDRVQRKNTELESTRPLTVSAIDGLIDQTEYFTKRIASKDVSGYYLVKNGEFAYNKSYSIGFPFGAVRRLDRYSLGVLSTLYVVFSHKPEQVNSEFLLTFFTTSLWHSHVSRHAAEGARNHGLLNISADDFFAIPLRVPQDKLEQEKIGAYFRNLNDLIMKHATQLEKLKNIKSACLNKMFV